MTGGVSFWGRFVKGGCFGGRLWESLNVIKVNFQENLNCLYFCTYEEDISTLRFLNIQFLEAICLSCR